MARNKGKCAVIALASIVCFLADIVAQQELFTCSSVTMHVVDERRKELYTNDQAHPWRELMVRVWYPVDSTTTDIISDRQRQYPLLLFSHGLGGLFNGDSYSTLCEACVKDGYIVVTISHSYACKPVRFPDGRMTTHSFTSVAPWYRSGREMESWEADIEYVLNQCQKYTHDETSFLYNRLDFTKIGIFGHSYGGAAAVHMCRKDGRIRAAINLDGPLRGNSATVPFGKPLLFIIGSLLPHAIGATPLEVASDIAWSRIMHSKEIHMINALVSTMSSDVYKVIIDGIRHTTFSHEIFHQYSLLDRSLIDPVLAHTIISSYVVDFFNVYIKGLQPVLLDQLVSPYLGVVVEKK